MSKFSDLKQELNGDVSNKKTFNLVTYIVLCLVAVFMTAVNIITDKGFLTLCTGIFAVLCLVDIILSLINEPLSNVAKWLFSVEVLLMFTYFLISGNPDGFSAIWICMLPSLGMFFFDRIRGTALCIIMFLILAFLLWTPIGNGILQYDYNDTFKMRFPILFVAFHLLAFFLESLRVRAYKEMNRMQAYYKDLSIRDQLTGLYNRQGFYFALENDEKYASPELVGAAIFDIDHFKQINDTYGHNTGDMVLKEFAKILKETLGTVVCRWGGEEFVAVVTDEVIDINSLKKAKAAVEEHIFFDGENAFHITMSVGVCIKPFFDIKKVDKLIECADEALYVAKESGRNRIIRYDEIENNFNA